MINSPLVPRGLTPLDQNTVKHSQKISSDLPSSFNYIYSTVFPRPWSLGHIFLLLLHNIIIMGESPQWPGLTRLVSDRDWAEEGSPAPAQAGQSTPRWQRGKLRVMAHHAEMMIGLLSKSKRNFVPRLGVWEIWFLHFIFLFFLLSHTKTNELWTDAVFVQFRWL